MKPEIFDNFLPLENFKKLSEIILSEDFNWTISYGVSTDEEFALDKSKIQFCHLFYANYRWCSPYAEILSDFIEILRPFAIIRIKANLLPQKNDIIKYDYHRDVGRILVKSRSAIFYINTNNGYTFFNSGFEVSSVANRLVMFDSSELHGGTSCTDEYARVVINFNYFTSV